MFSIYMSDLFETAGTVLTRPVYQSKQDIYPTSHQVRFDMKSFERGSHAQIETRVWMSK